MVTFKNISALVISYINIPFLKSEIRNFTIFSFFTHVSTNISPFFMHLDDFTYVKLFFKHTVNRAKRSIKKETINITATKLSRCFSLLT